MAENYGADRIDTAIEDSDQVRVTMPGEGDIGLFARADLNTLAPEKFFVYFDVGRWGQTQYNFGLVFGDGAHSEILLCEYLPGCTGEPQLSGYFPQILGLLNSAYFRRKVKVLKSLRFPRTLGLDTQNKLYVFLGDLHLAVVGKPPATSIEEVRKIFWKSTKASIQKGTEEAVGGAAITKTVKDFARDYLGTYCLPAAWAAPHVAGPAADLTVKERLAVSDVDDEKAWWTLYNEGDIFCDAGESLADFADSLSSYVKTEQPNYRVHFVQMGDLYDLWIGLQRAFNKNGSQAVTLASSVAASCVRSWISATHRNNIVGGSWNRACLLDKLHNCNVDQKTWISGNHDNYMLAINGEPGDPPKRVEHLFDNGIQIEHGHRADEFNRDGAIEGHLITQLVFVESLTRLLDPDRRQSLYFPYSTLKFRDSGKSMKLFVMAHTHAPYLAPVYVTGKGV